MGAGTPPLTIVSPLRFRIGGDFFFYRTYQKGPVRMRAEDPFCEYLPALSEGVKVVRFISDELFLEHKCSRNNGALRIYNDVGTFYPKEQASDTQYTMYSYTN